MKLYSAGLSPYAVRARLAIRAKGLPVEIVAPPQAGLKSPDYLALNPMGKVPVLVLDDGTGLPESIVIVEYLEDKFPDKPLMPASAEDRARVRLIARVAELYVMSNIGPLFSHMNPADRDQAVVDAQLVKVEDGLSHLEHYFGAGPYAFGTQLTLADCEAVPALFFANVAAQAFGKPDLVAGRSKLAAYLQMAQGEPVLSVALHEMAEGLKNFRRG